VPYQGSAVDVAGVIRQFGFESPVLLGEGLGCVSALLLGAWYPEHVGRLILAAAKWHVSGESLEARALSDCPPDLQALRRRVQCQVTEVDSAEEVAATLP
jgi:pimeloyl-ACP methyl ester carboxylesterase